MIPLSPRTEKLSRSVVANQILFTAGYSLTSGGFISFFAADLGADRSAITWILALPELVGMIAIFTPGLLRWVKNKKQLFLGSSMIARLASLLVPAVLFLPNSEKQIHLLIAAIILLGIFQAIAYTAYLSWLTDLAPEQNWGRFFARRHMAKAAMLLFVPFCGAMLRDWFKSDTTPENWRLFGYVITFGVGNLLQLASLIPLLKWESHSDKKPALAITTQREVDSQIPKFSLHGSRQSLIFILLFSWWLAFFQGLTQTAFFLHGYQNLKISLTTYYLLAGSMYLIQLVMSWWAGIWGDRKGYRNLLILSTLFVSISLLFWIATIKGNWFWIWGAYLIWGGFGAVNLSLQNLLFKIIPQGENTLAIALQRNGSGLIAGITGLAGGFWLAIILAGSALVQLPWGTMNPFLFLFLLSFAGRLLAPLWLLGVKPDSETARKE